MRCVAVVVALGIGFGFSLALELHERDDSSLDIFSDPDRSDSGNSNLSLDDENLFEDPSYSDSLFASTCDAGSDPTLPSKIRVRDIDNGFCLDKNSPTTPPTLSWPDLPSIFKKLFPPKREPEQYGPVPNDDGSTDQCWPPYKFHLCCEGEVFGRESADPSNPSIASLMYWSRIENCFASMRFKMLPPV